MGGRGGVDILTHFSANGSKKRPEGQSSLLDDDDDDDDPYID